MKSGNGLGPLLYFLCLEKNFLPKVNILSNTVVVVKGILLRPGEEEHTKALKEGRVNLYPEYVSIPMRINFSLLQVERSSL